MLKNVKFNFEDNHFSTVFLILVSVGWFSLTLSGPSSNTAISKPVAASISTHLPASVNQRKVAASVAKIKKQEAQKAREIASTENKPAEKISERAVRDLRVLTNRINDKAGSVVVSYDDAGPIEKLHLNADFILLTDGRPRVSAEKSRMVAPAIAAFSAGKSVTAFIDYNTSTPEGYITAIENYMKSYSRLKVERRLLTTVQNQLELTLEIQ
jgi:hypothetical protein